MFLVTHALDRAIDFLRRRDSSAGRIHAQNDGLDGIVVAKLLELRHYHPWINNDAFQVHHADLVAKAVQRRVLSARMQGQINQRKDRQHEEEENSSPNHDPEQSAGTTILSHNSEGSLAPVGKRGFEFQLPS